MQLIIQKKQFVDSRPFVILRLLICWTKSRSGHPMIRSIWSLNVWTWCNHGI